MNHILRNFLLKSVAKDKIPDQTAKHTQAYSIELGLILLEHLESQLNRSDSKAQFTLAANTIILMVSSISINLAEHNGIACAVFDTSESISVRLSSALFVLLYFSLLHSTIFALSAVMPKFSFPSKNDNVFYFGSIIGTNESVFIQKIKNMSQEELDEMLLSEIYVLASLAQVKFLKIKKSHRWLLIALAAWATMQGLIIFSN